MLNAFSRYFITPVVLISVLWASSAQADDFFDETFGNLQEDLETAQDEGKKGVFIFFHMEECPFCHRMKTTILNQPEVIDYYKEHFLSFSVDIEGSMEMTDFDGSTGTAQSISEKKYRVRATPVMMMFDLEGKPLLKYTGPTRTQEEFMWLGQFVTEEAYKTTSFTRYKRAKKREARQE